MNILSAIPMSMRIKAAASALTVSNDELAAIDGLVKRTFANPLLAGLIGTNIEGLPDLGNFLVKGNDSVSPELKHKLGSLLHDPSVRHFLASESVKYIAKSDDGPKIEAALSRLTESPVNDWNSREWDDMTTFIADGLIPVGARMITPSDDLTQEVVSIRPIQKCPSCDYTFQTQTQMENS